MLKKLTVLLLLLSLGGCAVVTIPNYIQDVNPYKQKFYSGFDETLKASTDAIEYLRFEITGVSDPSVFEHNKDVEERKGNHILVFARKVKKSLFLGTNYSRLNVYVRPSAIDSIEVEIRYVTVTSVIFKSFYHYRNDQLVKKIFNEIESRLK